MREVDSTKISDILPDDRETCFHLTNHNDTQCKSLLNKTYSSAVSDTETLGASRFDAGRFILLYKIVNKITNDITVEKITILGPNHAKEINTFGIKLTGIDGLLQAYEARMRKPLIREYVCKETGEDIFSTTTKDVLSFITFTKSFIRQSKYIDIVEPTLKFFDSSCNSIISHLDTTKEENVIVIKTIHDYLLNKMANGEGIHGGYTKSKRKLTCKTKRRINKYF